MVLVTRREHALLHLLLHKSYPNETKLAQCAAIMCGSKGSRVYKSLAYIQSCEEKSKLIAESNRRREVTWGDKISKALSGKEKTEEHRENLSESMKQAWINDPTLRDRCSREGSTQSEESRKKTSESISRLKWYWKIVDGVVIRTRSEKHPGEGWERGKNPR